MQRQELKEKVLKLIADNELEKAIEHCLNTFEVGDTYYEKVIIISSNFHKWKIDDLMGLNPGIGNLNKISLSIIEIVNNYANSKPQKPLMKESWGEKEAYENFLWLEKSPDHIESFDSGPSTTVFRDYEERVWSGKIENGVYKLINKIDENAVTYHFLNIDQQNMAEFATSIEVKLLESNHANSACGLMFCYNENPKKYYSFTIDDSKQYKLWLRTEAGYKPLLSGRSNLILPNEFNKIGFIKSDKLIYLFINDKYLRKVNENTIGSGDTGIIAISKGEFLFDNLSFYRL
jgi:hypothetical protein